MQEFGQLQQECQRLLQESSKVQNLYSENAALRDELESLQELAQERLARLTEFMSQSEKELAKLREQNEKELAKLREEKDASAQQCSSLQKVVDKMRDRAAEFEAELAALKEQMKKDRQAMLKPVHHPEGTQFSDEIEVILCSGMLDSTVYYTLDESDPSPSNCAGSGPSPLTIKLLESAVVQAVCITIDGLSGKIGSEEYVKREVKKIAPPPPPRAERAAPPVAASPPPVVQAQVRPPSASLLAGVGMLLERFDGDDRVFVKRVVPGSPADRCGQILIGDILLSGAALPLYV